MTESKTVIVGLGKTGLSCVRYLTRKGQTVAVVDSREDPPGLAELKSEFPEIEISLGGFNEALLSQANEIVISPGVSKAEPAIAKQVARGALIVGDIELFARDAKAPIVAITGSNGKSTVTTMVGEMVKQAGLKVKVGGNIGTPVLEMLEGEVPDYYVLELSSFQLETVYSLQAIAAVVINVAPDHMDRYKNFDEYVAAKQRIYHGCFKSVINRDDETSYQGADFVTLPKSFGLGEPKEGEFGIKDKKLCYGEKTLMAIDELSLKTKCNIANALAALALGRAIDLPLEAMKEALHRFRGLPHRCELVRNINGVDWYDDSKGTNVGATLAALESVADAAKGKVVLVAGGLAKDADFSKLKPPVEKHARAVVLIGEDAKTLAAALDSAVEINFAKSMEEAVAKANEKAQQGDAVLLSPACASFDMFTGFEHRGDVFKQAVKNLS